MAERQQQTFVVCASCAAFVLHSLKSFEKEAVLVSIVGRSRRTALKKITILAIALLCSTSFALARGGHGGRVSYGGGHHSYSHGGTYLGGSGSSHRGGLSLS